MSKVQFTSPDDVLAEARSLADLPEAKQKELQSKQ